MGVASDTFFKPCLLLKTDFQKQQIGPKSDQTYQSDQSDQSGLIPTMLQQYNRLLEQKAQKCKSKMCVNKNI